jgi:hypothetical protein
VSQHRKYLKEKYSRGGVDIGTQHGLRNWHPACEGWGVFKSACDPIYESDLRRMPVFPQKLERIASHAKVWKIDPGASPEAYLSDNCPKMFSVSALDARIV